MMMTAVMVAAMMVPTPTVMSTVPMWTAKDAHIRIVLNPTIYDQWFYVVDSQRGCQVSSHRFDRHHPQA